MRSVLLLRVLLPQVSHKNRSLSRTRDLLREIILMAQTVNGQENGTPQKQYRPGQRQQERMRFDDALGHRLADPPRAQDHILIDQGRDDGTDDRPKPHALDRKSTRLNSSHQIISYAVFCLKKKTKSTS